MAFTRWWSVQEYQKSAAMLQFHSRDQKKWVYDGPVVQENDPKIGGCFECPDLFQLDGKMVAVGCAWKLVLPDGRKQTEWYYIGERKDGCQLAVESKRIYDFGTNFTRSSLLSIRAAELPSAGLRIIMKNTWRLKTALTAAWGCQGASC